MSDEGLQPARVVKLLRLPVALSVRAQEHSDAVLRELRYIGLSLDEAGAPTHPPRLLEIMAELLPGFRSLTTPYREPVRAAHARGEQVVDLEVLVTPEEARGVYRIHELLSEVDAFSRSGSLLATATSPEIFAVREWLVENLVTQACEGNPAIPWQT